jgi:hypothetical protein
MTPDVISASGGQQVFGTRAARVDLLEEVDRGLPVRAYEAVATAAARECAQWLRKLLR